MCLKNRRHSVLLWFEVSQFAGTTHSFMKTVKWTSYGECCPFIQHSSDCCLGSWLILWWLIHAERFLNAFPPTTDSLVLVIMYSRCSHSNNNHKSAAFDSVLTADLVHISILSMTLWLFWTIDTRIRLHLRHFYWNVHAVVPFSGQNVCIPCFALTRSCYWVASLISVRE